MYFNKSIIFLEGVNIKRASPSQRPLQSWTLARDLHSSRSELGTSVGTGPSQ